MEFELGIVHVTSKEAISEDYVNSGIITDIREYNIIIQSDGGYELNVSPYHEFTGKYGVWKVSCDPDELIGKHVAYIGTHGLRLDDNSVIRPYVESFNIRDALGLGD